MVTHLSLSLRRNSLLPLLTVLIAGAGSSLRGEEPLNVIVYFVDDMGWTDVGCFGSDFYETPNIDRLAAEGVRFTNAYSACTVCSPSRAALLTGKYPARLHVTDFIPGHPFVNTPLLIPEWTQQLNLEEVTVAEQLKTKGYHTAHFGKWHLTPRDRTDDPNDDGNFPEFYPDRQGFDFNIGGCERGAPASYYWPYGRGKTLEEKKNNNTFRTIPDHGATEDTYLTDQLADEAVRLIGEFDQDPFFIYFPFYNVHTPLQGREDLVEKYRKKLEANPNVTQKNIQYAAMVESVDEAIGRIMAQVAKQGVSDRTMVIFSSDNGGLYPQSTTNRPLRQGKGSIYEGGVRVPTIIRWPGGAKAGAVSEEPVITIDFFSTILDATGAVPPTKLGDAIDGLSLVPLLKDPSSATLDRDAIFWHYPHYHSMGGVPYSAVRMGDWKLIEQHGGIAPVELYHLSEDIHEDHNLAETEPERTAAMLKRLQDWRHSVDAQMPTKNPSYDPGQPVGISRGGKIRPMAVVRE
ncbi:MAG: sulfatase [Verrucomicrobiae bacterium]|nr:sulfatase [Verrucomicrobiae bacterium]